MINYEQQNSQQMIILALWTSDRLIVLQQDAIRMVNNFNMGQINIVCFEGFQQKRYDISQRLGRSTIRSAGLDNCLLMRPTPILQPKTYKYLYTMEMIASNDQAQEDLHLFTTLISNVVVVAVGSGERINYLGSVANRMAGVASARQNNNMQNYKHMKTACLVCIQAVQNQNNPQFLVETTEKLYNRFAIEGIQNQVGKVYPVIKGFQCADQSLSRSTQGFQQKLMQQVEIVSSYQKANSELMYNRILVKYMQNICMQINTAKGGVVNIDKAEDDIVIDQGYEAYMAGVEQYHNTSLSLIDKNQRPDDNQLQEMLNVGKSKALQQFYAKGGSTNLEYRRMLEDYIGNKNIEVINAYSGEQWNKNLQILQVESKSVLDRITQSRTRDNATITGYIDQMTRNYESSAKGPQKYQILNDYMKVFTPIAFQADPQKQAMLRKQQKRNMELQQKLAQLKKVKGGCCSKCVIM